jgi:Protein of unknown function (DUF2934)
MWHSERANLTGPTTLMPNQETPSKREIADYVDNSDFPDDKAKTALKPALDHACIAALAYAMWQSKGCPEGSDHEDWFNAERELKNNGHRDPGVAAS